MNRPQESIKKPRPSQPAETELSTVRFVADVARRLQTDSYNEGILAALEAAGTTTEAIIGSARFRDRIPVIFASVIPPGNFGLQVALEDASISFDESTSTASSGAKGKKKGEARSGVAKASAPRSRSQGNGEPKEMALELDPQSWPFNPNGEDLSEMIFTASQKRWLGSQIASGIQKLPELAAKYNLKRGVLKKYTMFVRRGKPLFDKPGRPSALDDCGVNSLREICLQDPTIEDSALKKLIMEQQLSCVTRRHPGSSTTDAAQLLPKRKLSSRSINRYRKLARCDGDGVSDMDTAVAAAAAAAAVGVVNPMPLPQPLPQALPMIPDAGLVGFHP